jgi:TPR repeat protein
MLRTLAVVVVLVAGLWAWPTSRHWCLGQAENNVGALYAHGLLGSGGPAKSLAWYESAAALGTPAAAFNLGFAYQNGLGTPVDAAKAAHWYETAARAGVAEAGNNLAMLYSDGALGHADLGRARAWLKFSMPLASGALGDTLRENVAAVEHGMSPAEIEASDRLVASGLH